MYSEALDCMGSMQESRIKQLLFLSSKMACVFIISTCEIFVFSYKIVVHNMNSEIAIRREQFFVFFRLYSSSDCLFVCSRVRLKTLGCGTLLVKSHQCMLFSRLTPNSSHYFFFILSACLSIINGVSKWALPLYF